MQYKRILIIEVGENIRSFLENRAQPDDWVLISASTREEILLHVIEDAGLGAIILNQEFDDPQYPIIPEIKKLNPYVRILIVSNKWDLSAVRIAMNHGVYDWLVKPLKIKPLVNSITKALSLSSARLSAAQTRQKLLSLQRELEIAGNVQNYILPENEVEFPGCTISARMIPTRNIGGDFYDYFMIDQKRIGLLIGDVSGKGIPAALFMAMTKSLIKLVAASGVSPDICISQVNSALCKDNISVMFATVFYAILNTETLEMEYCNAGHEMPYVLNSESPLNIIPRTGDMAVGFDESVPFHSLKTTLKPGDRILFFTDGVNEAVNERKKMYGKKRLEHMLSESQKFSTTDMVNHLLSDLNQFTSGAQQSDDITMMAIGIKDSAGTQPYDSGNMILFSLENNIEQLTVLNRKLISFADEQNLVFKDKNALEIVLEELFTNIVNYAFPDDGKHEIEFEFARRDQEVRIKITENGVAFDPSQKREEWQKTSLEDRRIGGWGLQIVHKFMDQITYERRDGFNIVELTRKISD